MLKAIEAYLALRRATGFAMLNGECLLKSFAAFATEGGQTHVHTQTAIDWAARGPSAALCVTSGLKTPGMSCRRPITSAPVRCGARRTSTQQRRSIA